MTAGANPGFHIPWVAFFGRTLAEYLAMFARGLDGLRLGSTPDCPSGLDRFLAGARSLGGVFRVPRGRFRETCWETPVGAFQLPRRFRAGAGRMSGPRNSPY